MKKQKLLLSLILIMILSVAFTVSGATNLILWNKFEVNNSGQIPSAVGSNGTVYNSSVIESGKFNNGFRATAPYSGVWFENQDFSSLKYRGTIEFWFSDPNYDSFKNEINQYIFALEGEPRAWNGDGAVMRFRIVNSTQANLEIRSRIGANYRWEIIPLSNTDIQWNAGEFHHMAISWDADGIDGSQDRVRFFYDNNVVCTSISNFDFLEWFYMDATNGKDLSEGNGVVSLGITGYNADWKGSWDDAGYFGATYDNLKVYNYAKTDFNDRCSEDGSIPCTGTENIAPQITILEPDGNQDGANTNYTIIWKDFDPDDNAKISLYYDTDNTGNYGGLIVENINEDTDSTNGSYLWTTLDVANGSYYIYAKIDDGTNPPVYDYSSGKVIVFHLLPLEPPEAPTTLKATAGKDVVNLEWKKSISDNVTYYKVYRSKYKDFIINDQLYVGKTLKNDKVYHDRNIPEKMIYYYKIVAISSDNLESEPSNETWARPGTMQHNLILQKNKINPNKGELITVKFKVEKTSEVNVKIFNINGKLIREFEDRYVSAGMEPDYQWDGKDKNGKIVSSGVYVMQLFIDDKLIETKKMLIAK